MTWTRLDFTTAIREEARATSSPRWSDDRALKLLGHVHSREFKRLLDVNPDYRTATLSVTADTSARIAKSSLSTGAGDSKQRLYKVRGISSSALPYQQVDAADWQLSSSAATQASGTGVWWEAGSYLQLLPGDASQALSVVVNHTPTPADELSADTVAPDWPEDHELLLVYETAALMLARGGDETDAAADFQALAGALREALYAELGRPSTRPTAWRYGDSAGDWGG